MAKKSRTKNQSAPTVDGEVGPRQPCPCGSGKRYKACHGAAGGAAPTFVARPFEGMPSECDVIALRELVPAATAPLTLEDGTRNPFALQRLKDKLGNRSNASSEVEYDGTWATLVGEEGRGVRTIIEMVSMTRLDCALLAAALD